jgi:hypothetical protein
MARGDRVVILVRVPPELRYIVNLYSHRYQSVSRSAAIRQLLETHPALVELAEMLYDLSKPEEGPAD